MRGKRITLEYHLSIRSARYPVRVFLEPRRNCSFSVTPRNLLLRLPRNTRPQEITAHLSQLKAWAEEMMDKYPKAFQRIGIREYRDGDLLRVGERQYTLRITEDKRRTHTARLQGNTILLCLREEAPPVERAKAVQTLLSRILAADFREEIEQRVHRLNRQTVNRPIRRIALKYNTTNWGSCSGDGNINLSTRLLFAPAHVQDYVILHELVHLVEPNHSDRFWATLAHYMPDYEQREQWLRENGHHTYL